MFEMIKKIKQIVEIINKHGGPLFEEIKDVLDKLREIVDDVSKITSLSEDEVEQLVELRNHLSPEITMFVEDGLRQLTVKIIDAAIARGVKSGSDFAGDGDDD